MVLFSTPASQNRNEIKTARGLAQWESSCPVQREPRVLVPASQNRSTGVAFLQESSAQQLLPEPALCRSDHTIPVTREKEAGGLCSKPQATLSCVLIESLPQKDNETSTCTVQTQQWMRKSESPTLRRQTADKITASRVLTGV